MKVYILYEECGCFGDYLIVRGVYKYKETAERAKEELKVIEAYKYHPNEEGYLIEEMELNMGKNLIQ